MKPLTKLSQHLKASGETPSAFAERIGVEPSTVTRVINGDRRAGGDLINKICAGTDWALQPNDFFEVPERGAAA